MQKTIPSSRRLKGSWPRAGYSGSTGTLAHSSPRPHLPKPSATYGGQTKLGGGLKSRSYSDHWLLSPQRGAHHSSERNRCMPLTLSPPPVFPSSSLQGREGQKCPLSTSRVPGSMLETLVPTSLNSHSHLVTLTGQVCKPRLRE